MFPSNISEAKENVIHLPSSHSISKRKRMFPTIIFESNESKIYILSFHFISKRKYMFPAIIFKLNESEIHFLTFCSTPKQKLIFPTNISEAKEKGCSVLSFISKRKCLFLTIILESNEGGKRSPSFHSISPNENIYVCDECIWGQIEWNICSVLSLYL